MPASPSARLEQISVDTTPTYGRHHTHLLAHTTRTYWQVPASPSARLEHISVGSNGNDPQAGPHLVPVAPHGGFTYYDTPYMSRLEPPGGPVLGGTSVRISGGGFGGMGEVVSPSLLCVFEGAGGAVWKMGGGGDELWCAAAPSRG